MILHMVSKTERLKTSPLAQFPFKTEKVIYIRVQKGHPITTNNELIKDIMLYHTFSCPTFSEYRVRTLNEAEKNLTAEEVLKELPGVMEDTDSTRLEEMR